MLSRRIGLAVVFTAALAVSGQDAISIGQNRECFFDDYLLDMARTTAPFRVHQPGRFADLVRLFDYRWSLEIKYSYCTC